MATFTVRQGLNLAKKLPETQLLIIGRKSALKLGLDENNTKKLAEKLAPEVNSEHLGRAKTKALANESVPLYLDLAKISSVPDEVSRYNTPSNSCAIYKEMKAIKIAKGVKHLSIVLYSDYSTVMASVAAVARAFPLFSAKSKKETTLEDIELELMLVSMKTGEQQQPTELNEKEMTFLQSLADNIRSCGRLIDTPTCIMHSEKFLEEALAMVDGLGSPIGKTIIKDKELLEKGFGGIYSVGQAAIHPPIFACFSHMPKGATETYAFVGKGIVYDTGGLSLKGKLAMPTMKIDMGGAAGVLSAFCTLVKSGFVQNLHCLLCIAENHISPKATRPDDIIKMLSGKTVEVNNTDAEGRLVLADGVFYAKEVLKADTIIDMATLTGAQLTATGKYHAAILCNSEQLEAECVKAGKKSGDLVHPLPFAPEMHFAENLSSKVADMKNARIEGSATGPPSAVAGLFIGSHIDYGHGGTKGTGANANAAADEQNEAPKTLAANWLHIDMACLALSEGRATGYGVALLCSLLAKHTGVDVAKIDQ